MSARQAPREDASRRSSEGGRGAGLWRIVGAAMRVQQCGWKLRAAAWYRRKKHVGESKLSLLAPCCLQKCWSVRRRESGESGGCSGMIVTMIVTVSHTSLDEGHGHMSHAIKKE